jgi:hypothetical protein
MSGEPAVSGFKKGGALRSRRVPPRGSSLRTAAASPAMHALNSTSGGMLGVTRRPSTVIVGVGACLRNQVGGRGEE